MTEEKSKESFMRGKGWLVVIIGLFAAYQIYTGLRDMIASKRAQQQWNAEDRRILVEKCIKETRAIAAHQQLARNYCECAQDNLSATYTKQEYVEISKKPIEDQMKTFLPSIQGCLAVYQNALKQAGE